MLGVMQESLRRRKMTRLFEMLDANSDGFLEVADFELITERAAKIRNLTPTSPELQRFRELVMNIWKAQQAVTPKARIPRDEWLAAREAVLADKQGFRQRLI